MRKAIVLLGPTATGKSDVAIYLYENFKNLEIVSADSMQFYRGMDIATAKVSFELRKKIPHYMTDIITVEEEFNVADFKRECLKVFEQIYRNNNIPLLVGGSGLYLRAITENFPVENTAPRNMTLREELSKLPLEELRIKASQIDLEATTRIGRTDRKRLIRVIEYFEETGKKISQVENPNSDLRFLKVGLTLERSKLYKRVNDRVDEMFVKGFVEEVQGLKNNYADWSNTALQAIGYKEILKYLSGELTLGNAKDKIKQRTRNFAKRQITWFKKEADVKWFDVQDSEKAKKEIYKIVEEFINEN